MSPAPDPTPVRGCAAPGCDRAAVAKGLCLKHYKRQRAGKPLVDVQPEIGSPSGVGRFGIFEDSGAAAMCHECGAWVRSVAAHLTRAHDGMTAAQYREAHGLPRGLGLVCSELRAEQSDRARARIGGPGWRRLERARDPAAAAAARDAAAFVSSARSRPAETSVRNGRAGRKVRVVECSECGAAWCPLPGGYSRKRCSPECISDHAARMTRAAARRARES